MLNKLGEYEAVITSSIADAYYQLDNLWLLQANSLSIMPGT